MIDVMTVTDLQTLINSGGSNIATNKGLTWISEHSEEYLKLLRQENNDPHRFFYGVRTSIDPQAIVTLATKLPVKAGIKMALVLRRVAAAVTLEVFRWWSSEGYRSFSLDDMLKSHIDTTLIACLRWNGWMVGVARSQLHQGEHQLRVCLQDGGTSYIKFRGQRTYPENMGQPKADDLVAFKPEDARGGDHIKYVRFLLLRSP